MTEEEAKRKKENLTHFVQIKERKIVHGTIHLEEGGGSNKAVERQMKKERPRDEKTRISDCFFYLSRCPLHTYVMQIRE